jgi:hypothetical protein
MEAKNYIPVFRARFGGVKMVERQVMSVIHTEMEGALREEETVG